ncbi:IS110 family transposase [bacterium]|nr:IS110 family transposase [bacterium]
MDTHKDTLAGCAIDGAGRPIEHRNIANTAAGFEELTVWARHLDADRVEIEGSGNFGRPAAVALIESGLVVVEVPPQMTAKARKGTRTGTKTDQVDALLIARIGLRDDDLPPPRPVGPIEDLRLLVGFRRQLVEERNRAVNRVHADLEQLVPGYQHRVSGRLTIPGNLTRVMRLLTGDTSARALIAKNRIRRVRDLNRQIDELAAVIRSTVTESHTTLTDIDGVGELVAAEILAHVGAPHRFATKAKFAMANGTAPLEASSGRVRRHRLNRGGNRQLNKAIHTVAITQIARPDTEGRRYYEHRLATGNSEREAIRALKRRISDRIWTHLQTPTSIPNWT